MKKSYIKIVFLFLGLTLSFYSCSEFLEKENDTEASLEIVFNSKVKTEQWLAGCYSMIPDPIWGYANDLGWEVLADDMTPSERWRSYGWEMIPYALGNWSTDTNWSPGYWAVLPQKIRECNILMQNVNAIPQQKFTENDVKLMIGEARFLRAYYYSLLINTYGPVPFNPEEIVPVEYNLPDLLVGQTPFDEIVSWIDNELEEVSKILPASSEGRQYGRATSIMCKAVRARMLLFAASPLVNGNPDYASHINKEGKNLFNTTYDANKWKIAAEASKDLIESAEAAGHKLYIELNADGDIDPFMSCQNLFFIEASRGNPEILFARPESNHGEYDKHSAPLGSGGFGGYGVTQSLVDAFFTANGLPISDPSSGYAENGFSSEDGYWGAPNKTKWDEVKNTKGQVTVAGTYKMYCNREPRFYLAVNFDGQWYPQGERELAFFNGQQDNNGTHDSPQNGYLVRKKTDPQRDPIRGFSTPRQGIVYRLGEVYLNYAEALNESNPGNDEILFYLNKIRERAGVRIYTTGGTDATSIHIDLNDQDNVRELIHMERRVELCTEGIRYDDLRRWKEAEDKLNTQFYGMNFYGKNTSEFYQRTPYQTRIYRKSFYWFPVHLSEIVKNPNLVQAPYW
ncbi:RagB/SusD family nutrient uptake outer membrane protein [Polaribacter vadi]|uniref:RagB/SusD family nutrient uptake outer membrane protein n=1 Tax=Polaribacter vadi TaxID=1774273 RepID=UPI0030EBEB5E|tara:strand:- start:58782 stop:60656 length:1875 start_codon:yes stop_codon:yes gene_type:complete